MFGFEGDIRRPAPKKPSPRGNFPTPGSVRFAAAPVMRSTTSCSSAPAVLPSANCAPPPSACRNPIPMRAGRSAPAPRWALRPELERQGRIPLCRSGQQQLRHYRCVKRLSVRLDPGRRELSLLRTKNCLISPPGGSKSPGFFVQAGVARGRRAAQRSGRRSPCPARSSQPGIQSASNESVGLR